MSEATLPKEQLTAFQRWELPSFDERQRVAANLPTADELEAMHEEARKEGFEQGLAEGKTQGEQAGHEAGYAAGYAEGAEQVARVSQQLADLLQTVQAPLDAAVEQELVALALAIAQQVIRHTLSVQPEAIVSVVREAVAQLPHFAPGAHLVLHPEDATLVRQEMGEQLSHTGWKILEDRTLERGGARVETAHSQIDATLPARWQQIVAALGQESSWDTPQ